MLRVLQKVIAHRRALMRQAEGIRRALFLELTPPIDRDFLREPTKSEITALLADDKIEEQEQAQIVMSQETDRRVEQLQAELYALVEIVSLPDPSGNASP